MLRTTALTGVIAMLIAAPAAAQNYKGFYGSVLAGLNMADEQDADYLSNGEFDYEGGSAVGAAIGYAYGGGLRGELELMNRSNDVDSVLGLGAVDGETDVTSLMVNAVYDLDIAGGAIVPFIGAGVGYARAKTEISAGAGDTLTALGVSESDGSGAWQAFAGLAIPLADNLSIAAQYRYFSAMDGFDYDNSGVIGAPPAVTVNGDYDVQTILASITWNFGAAAPVRPKVREEIAPAPVASAAPVAPVLLEEDEALEDIELTIYFDLNSSALTNAARTLIANAAAQAQDGEISSVTIEGNTDSSGSSAYNQVLSQRRANVVREALIAQGVPASLISVNAFGEGQPATPTPDGAREPLNRRADVTIRFQ
ncbi:MAG: OmpA family protein [Pseudomonadota bacterium]